MNIQLFFVDETLCAQIGANAERDQRDYWVGGVNMKHQRTSNAGDFGANFKLHLHLVRVGETTYRVLVPRPGTPVRFSTNFFHETWHIVSDTAGAHLLGRLLWGLAFQKQPNTLIFLGGEFLAPTPFDAEPSDPIALVPAHLTPLCAKKFAVLKAKMSRIGAPQCSVSWRTWGLDDALGWGGNWWEHPLFERHHSRENEVWRSMEVMRRCGGWLCFSAMPLQLQIAALAAARLNPNNWRQGQMDYCEIADDGRGRQWRRDGEIQIFSAYPQMLRDADLARREIEGEQGSVGCLETDREQVQQRALEIKARRTKRTP